MTEKKWLLLCQRHIKIQQAAESISGQRPVSSLCPSALGPSKVAVGVSPQKAFGCQRQAKRSACPTCGWVKFAPPAVWVLEAPMLSVLWGDAEVNRAIEGCLSPPQRLKIKQAVGTRCPRTMGGVKCFSNLLLAEGRVDFVVVLQGDLLLLFPDSQSLPGPTAGFGGTTGI